MRCIILLGSIMLISIAKLYLNFVFRRCAGIITKVIVCLGLGYQRANDYYQSWYEQLYL